MVWNVDLVIRENKIMKQLKSKTENFPKKKKKHFHYLGTIVHKDGDMRI